ncbi:amidohydrolase [Silvanigrella sp.]|jgi:predicted amidohydrolase YtcJ|uniref:amidohydrolase n=1 Tax=Silvanigrella sp. TaxID=2024976 RepID=UPI0037C99166
MDPGWPEAKTVAICKDKIISVGQNLQDLEPWTSKNKFMIDKTFEKKVIVPGFIDPHQHALAGAIMLSLPNIAYFDTPTPYGPDIKGLVNEKKKKPYDAAMDRLSQFVMDMDKKDKTNKETLLVWGWDVPALGHLTTQKFKNYINSVTKKNNLTTRPILVWDASEHFAYGNESFLKLNNLTNVPNGQFLGVDAAGKALQPLISKMIEPSNDKEAIKTIHYLIDLNRKAGITTTTEHALGLVNLDREVDLFKKVYTSDNPMRLIAIPYHDKFMEKYNSVEESINYALELQKKNNDYLTFKGVKFYSDDSFNGLTMQLGKPGYATEHSGIWNTKPIDMYKKMAPWWKNGFQIFVHSVGTESHDTIIDVLEKLLNEKPRFDHRFTFEHFGISRADQIKKMKNLGASANVNIYYLWLRGEMYMKEIGKDRANMMSRLGSLIHSGVPMSVHSDTPVGPPKPLLAMSIAVNRLGQSGKNALASNESISVEHALKMVTIDAAYILGMDNKIGSIEAGKLADFTILKDNPLKFNKKKIADIQVIGTVVGGKYYPSSDIKE